MKKPFDPTEQPGTSAGASSRQIVHDLNNLLNVIKGYAELLRDETDKSDPLYKDLETIHDAAQRAADLASKLNPG